MGPSNSPQNVWWTFPKWIHDYYTFGRVPGVFVDGKHVANRLGLPLVALSGPDNGGHLRMFAIGFLRAEDEHSVTWFLKQFVNLFKHPPR